jgi:hypothetical protein
MDKILYAVEWTTPNDCIIMTQDGGIATIHKVEDDTERYTTTFYQDRAQTPLFDDMMWEQLDEGKVCLKDWVDKMQIDNAMITDALHWLMFSVPDEQFEQVDFSLLQNIILKS